MSCGMVAAAASRDKRGRIMEPVSGPRLDGSTTVSDTFGDRMGRTFGQETEPEGGSESVHYQTPWATKLSPPCAICATPPHFYTRSSRAPPCLILGMQKRLFSKSHFTMTASGCVCHLLANTCYICGAHGGSPSVKLSLRSLCSQ